MIEGRYEFPPESLLVICGTAALLGLLHTVIGPDHYVPFVMLGRANRWSASRLAAVTALRGGARSLLRRPGHRGDRLRVALRRLEIVESLRGKSRAGRSSGSVSPTWSGVSGARGPAGPMPMRTPTRTVSRTPTGTPTIPTMAICTGRRPVRLGLVDIHPVRLRPVRAAHPAPDVPRGNLRVGGVALVSLVSGRRPSPP